MEELWQKLWYKTFEEMPKILENFGLQTCYEEMWSTLDQQR